LLLVAGVVYAYKVEYLGDKNKEEAAKKEKKLFAFDQNSVDKIGVASNGETAELVKEKGVWKIISPLSADGDSDAINDILSSVTTTASTESVEGDAKDFGLEPPLIKLDFYHGGKSETLVVGAPSPTGASVYVKTSAGGKIMLAPSSLFHSVHKNLFQLRDKRFFTGSTEEFSKIEISTGGATITAEKGADGKWRVTNPVKGDADDGEINQLLIGIFYAKATEFADDKSEAETGLKIPSAKISLWKKDDKKTLLLGGETKDKLGIYAKIEGGRGTAVLPASFVRFLPRTADSLMEKKMDSSKQH